MAAWSFVVLALLSIAAVVRFIDLSPRVEGDFFFAPDDPQMQTSEEIARRFPAPTQLVVRVAASDIGADSYVAAIAELTSALRDVTGVTNVTSISTASPLTSPLWQRLLFTPDGRATNLIVQADTTPPEVLVPALTTVVDSTRATGLELQVSGVPYIVELIRQRLFRDLVVFSSAAFLGFGVLITLVYRRSAILLGTLTACVTACAITLSVAHLLGIAIGLLTANIVTIVFVLTLSHVVFLTANWQQALRGELPGSGHDPVATAVRTTLEPSFWSMFTTLCGFLSLLIATARPLRELGFAGALGAITALIVAYGVYPAFLRLRAEAVAARPEDRFEIPLPRRHAGAWLAGIAVVVMIAGFGLPRVNTDPSLLSYFADGTEIREGLEAIDRDGGSSSLNVALRDSLGGRVDTDDVQRRMWDLQLALERDTAVGVVLSPALLLAHAKSQPLASLLNWSQLLGILDSPRLGRIARSFVDQDREEALFSIRMRESSRDEPRAVAVQRIRRVVMRHGFEPQLVGGHYELQRQLGALLSSSLRTGLGGLVLLFVVVATVVSRRSRTVIAMVVCLSAIPVVVLGTMGLLDISIDLIAAPAANIALAMGVDSMIHLVVRARRLSDGPLQPTAFAGARAAMWRPILAATLIICSGFGIFGLSGFPPTQRFGGLVILGTVAAATMALVALPFLAGRHREA